MSLQQQMSLFQEGGLEQDGGTVDPVSGNEVPVGSAQEEVRDDIPAQLSEGEFVFPADVVRFIGLEKLMMMRQQAKAGLKRMEEMGQMGNSEEATIPDDVPFTIDDLDIENEPTKMQTGGDVNPNTGTYTIDSKFKRTPRMITDVFPPEMPSPRPPVMPSPPSNEEAKFYNQPKEGDPKPETPATYEELIGTKPYKYDELRKFVGPNGEIQYVAYKDGEPLPAYQDKVEELLEKGFTMEDPDAVEKTEPAETTVETAKVTEDKEGDSTSFENMRERENQIQDNYKNAIRRVMEQEGLSAEEAVQFIKDGNYTVMGRTVPGFLFPDIKLANQSRNQQKFIPFGLEEAANIVQSELDSLVPISKPAKVAQPNIDKYDSVDDDVTADDLKPSGVKIPKVEIQKLPPIGQTDDEFYRTKKIKTEKEMTDDELFDRKLQEERDKVEAEIARKKAIELAKTKKAQEEEAARVAARQAEQERIKAEQFRRSEEQARDDRERERQEREKSKTGTFDRDFQRDSSGRKNYKTGGIASKKTKKKKVMKRGGLASKK